MRYSKLLAKSFMILVILLNILLTKIPLVSGQVSAEKTGDIVQLVIPGVIYSMTFFKGNSDTRNAFYKSFFSTVLLTHITKHSILRKRPDSSDQHSYMSGHSAVAFSGAAFIQKQYGWKWGLPAYLAASFVGWSRIKAKRHYPDDVLRGAILGISSTNLSNFIRVQDETMLSRTAKLPYYLRDRGEGMSSSVAGAYISKGQFLVSSNFELKYDKNLEYKPAELGYQLDQDLRGESRSTKGIMFLGYGLTDRMVIELKTTISRSSLKKSGDDHSALPQSLKNSGIGYIHSQLRWRWSKETEKKPEYFNYFETVIPSKNSNRAVGIREWDIKFGGGAIKGFRIGTFTIRTAANYSKYDGDVEFGEFAVEYLKKISPHIRLFSAVGGIQDEIVNITEVQWHTNRNLYFKFNNSFGLTSKATDLAPQFGLNYFFR